MFWIETIFQHLMGNERQIERRRRQEERLPLLLSSSVVGFLQVRLAFFAVVTHQVLSLISLITVIVLPVHRRSVLQRYMVDRVVKII